MNEFNKWAAAIKLPAIDRERWRRTFRIRNQTLADVRARVRAKMPTELEVRAKLSQWAYRMRVGVNGGERIPPFLLVGLGQCAGQFVREPPLSYRIGILSGQSPQGYITWVCIFFLFQLQNSQCFNALMLHRSNYKVRFHP